MKRFSKASGIPLYRLQEVASFFPHIRLNPAPAVTVGVCQGMPCHLAGAGEMLNELRNGAREELCVEGVSCLGRCDRAPAVTISINSASGEEHDGYYLGRDISSLQQIVDQCVETKALPAGSDRDSVRDRERCYPSNDWVIDPYKGRSSNYQAVRNVVAARDEYLRRTAEMLDNKLQEAVENVRQQLGLPAGANLSRVRRDLKIAALRTEANTAPAEWVADILTELDKDHADLRGMGGAGVPATQKWLDVHDAVADARRRRQDERGFVVVNGDESEPGTFKDRELLLHYPHLVLESVILAGLATGATEGFIYIRHEYSEQIAACEAEIQRAEAEGLCGANPKVLKRPFPVSVFISPGGYICGEQTALIEAMSDRRGEPRDLSPSLATNGLDDKPTLISNVETFAWVPYIMLNGGSNYANLGANGAKGRRYFSVSGDVIRPGVYEVPIGLTLRKLILGEEYCQGIARNGKLKAIAPSGASGGFLPAKLTVNAGLPNKHTNNPEWQSLARRRNLDPLAQELDILDLELDLNLFRALSPTQALGAGIVVYAEDRDMVVQAVNALEFLRNESCGKCVPCRLGSQKLANLGADLLDKRIGAAAWKDDLLPGMKELGEAIGLTSICGLGRSVPMPIRTIAEYFRNDLAQYLM